MPPQIQQLLENKRLLMMIGGGLVAIVLVIVLSSMLNTKPVVPGQQKLKPDQLGLATVDNMGKAIEIQALLAREGIEIDRHEADGGKAELLLTATATTDDRDRALMSLVRSGLMDKNIGLEAFDKGDLTSSREEKRIKLVRAQQGELSRLIRHIDGVQDASVSLSIPEETLFKKDQDPVSASVQVVLNNGTRLSRDDVRSIINLMVGAVHGLPASRVSLTDTFGNTYHSMLTGDADLDNKLEEQDEYMQHKVATQLDQLVGPGRYVATVSTFLRQSPRETMVQTYDPAQSAIANKQLFSETINNSSSEYSSMGAGGPSSVNLPAGLDMPAGLGGGPGAGGNSRQQKGYRRQAEELAYANAKTQYIETSVPGMIEDISVAVTLEKSSMPEGLSIDELQTLIAHAASPKVDPGKVSIVLSDAVRPSLMGDKSSKNSGEASSAGTSLSGDNLNSVELKTDSLLSQPMWVWLLVGLGAVVVLILVLGAIANVLRPAAPQPAQNMQAQDLFQNGPQAPDNELKSQLFRTQEQVQQLAQLSQQQQAQLQAQQQQTQQLLQQLSGHTTSAQASARPKESLEDTLKSIQQATLNPEADEALENWLSNN